MDSMRKYNLQNLQNIVNEHLDYSEYLQLIKYMTEQYELIEITEYCKKHKLNDKTVRNRSKAGKIPHIIISKTIFIIEKLIY